MSEFHARLGEGLFLIYFIVIGVIFFLSRGNRAVPGWLLGISHALLFVQVALGLILLMEGNDIPWYHPVLGIAAILSLGLSPVFKQRLGATRGMMATMTVVGTLALVAMLAATM